VPGKFIQGETCRLIPNLGLDIVRRLVRHNDGEISVESQPGRTEFRVVLPLAETDGT